MTAAGTPGEHRVVSDISGLIGLEGTELGPTEWREMTQDRVDAFADATDDHNFIHVDPERARHTRFGGTVAHGFLTLSLLAPIIQRLIVVTDASMHVNYGLDRLRFPAPLPVGAQFRGAGAITEVSPVEGGVQIRATFTIEVRNAPRPALVAECLFRCYS